MDGAGYPALSAELGSLSFPEEWLLGLVLPGGYIRFPLWRALFQGR